MALFSADQLRSIDPGEAPQQGASRPHAALLDKLTAEAARPAYSRVVVVGAVRGIEFGMLLLTGLALFHLHVVEDAPMWPIYYLTSVGISMLAILVFQTLQSYTVPAFRRPVRQLFRMAGGWCAIFFIAFAAMFFLKADGAVSRVWIASWLALGFIELAAERMFLARVVGALARTGRLERRTVIVGGGEMAAGLLRDLAKADPAEVRLLGVFDDRTDERSPDTVEGLPKLGNVDDLVEFARATRIDLAIFALPISAEERILTMLRKLWVLPIDVRLAAHANRLRLRPRSYSYVGPAPMLDVFDKPLADWDVIIKLVFDKIVGTIALIVLSPILLATAIAIKLEVSRTDLLQAEALRLQQRTGRDLQVPVDARGQARL